MWWLTEFNGVPIPAADFAFDTPRQFAVAHFVPTGAPFGAYNLNGTRNRLNQQSYTYEFTYPSRCNYAARFEALLAAAQTEGTLKKSDGSRTLRATGSVNSVSDATTLSDYYGGRKRARIEYTAEPFWYSDTLKTVTFSDTSLVSLNTAARRNEGNARAVKHLVLTIFDAVTGSSGVPFSITFFYGGIYSARLELISDMAPAIVIDAGAHSVVEGRLGAWLLLEDGTPLLLEDGTPFLLENGSGFPDAGTDAYNKTRRDATQLPLLFLEGRQLTNGMLQANDAEITFSAPISGTLQFRDTWV